MSTPTPPESLAPEDTFERRALRNTRALVERLESDEAARHGRQKRALVVIAIGTGIAGIALFQFAYRMPVLSEAERLRADCEVTAMATISGERTEKIRAENPGMPFQEIAERLKPQGEAMLKEARERCAAAPKAGR